LFVELQHAFTVPAPVDQAWSTLLDVEGIAPCFPGATLTGVEGDSFSGTVKVKLGPVSLQYAGKGRFLERDEAARRVVLEANGSDKRGNGTAGATVQARLEPAGDNETRVVVDTDLKVTGRPAQFGRGVLQDVGGRIIEQFATCLATRMAPQGEDAAAGEATASEALSASDVPAAADVPAAGDATGSEGTASDVPAAADVPAAGDATASEGTASEGTAQERSPSGIAAAAEEPTAATAASARAATSSTRRSPAPTPAPRTPARTAELDLNRVVLPALARRYGPPLFAVLLALIVVRILLRRRH
jgi:carbon monoxide dehydrogenase subunit G